MPSYIHKVIVNGAKVSPGSYSVHVSKSHSFTSVDQVNVPVVMSCCGTSGTSSAKTTAKPLGWRVRIKTYRRMDHERVQVPINVAVEEPRARIVSKEPDRDIIAIAAHAHDVANDRIIKVVCRITSTADYGERVTM